MNIITVGLLNYKWYHAHPLPQFIHGIHKNPVTQLHTINSATSNPGIFLAIKSSSQAKSTVPQLTCPSPDRHRWVASQQVPHNLFGQTSGSVPSAPFDPSDSIPSPSRQSFSPAGRSSPLVARWCVSYSRNHFNVMTPVFILTTLKLKNWYNCSGCRVV